MDLDFSLVLPKAVYKYRDLDNEKHLRLVTHQEIYFANPSEFNADHDCTLIIDREYVKDETNRREYYRQKLGVAANDPAIDEQIRLNPITDGVLDKFEEFQREFFESKIGVFSVSKTFTNEHLWKEFGANKKGFCIEMDPHFLESADGRGVVHYVKEDDLPKSKVIDTDDMEIIKFFSELVYTLPEKYSDEQELRIHKYILEEKDRFTYIPKETIKSVIIGENMSKKKRAALIELVKKHLPATTIKRLKYSPTGPKVTLI